MRLLIVVLLILWGGDSLWAQSRSDKLFERGNYLEALKLYEQELEALGGDATEKKDRLRIRIANCFFHLNDVVRAGQMYKTVNPDWLEAEDLAFYAVTLVHSGDYQHAQEEIDIAEELGADPVIVARVRNSCAFAALVAKEKPLYVANKTKIDFAGFSSGVTYYKGRGSIILAAPGLGENAMKDNRGYKVTRLFNAQFGRDGESGRLLPFADELGDKYHIGAVTFSSDYKRIYYTRTILKKDGSSILRLMTAVETGGKWGEIEELDINSDDYSCAHPCLFKDSLLFFVSDMPGGIGGKDIYVTEVQGSKCGDIRNLGERINTISDELFPFVSEDAKLYFASNGHVGLGGLDIFVSEMQQNGEWGDALNMGRPINSSMDDFALVFKDMNCREGFVSTNRGGTGYNDFLFSLKLLPTAKPVQPRPLPKLYQPKPVEEMAEQREPEVSRPREVVQQQVAEEDMFTVDYRYAIQIGAFRNPVPRVYFDKFQNVKVYLGYDNIYRYTVGEYPDEGLAQMELPKVRRVMKDAFVMNVGRYVAEKKIQHDIKGDDISDDELLLRRLKNFEKEGKRVPVPKMQSLPLPRTLEKPKEQEMKVAEKGYTVVLMSADQVFDPSEFKGIGEVDVFAISKGKYMYCAGIFSTIEEANMVLNQARQSGFNDAYVLRRKGEGLYTKTESTIHRDMKQAAPVRNGAELKKLLE